MNPILVTSAINFSPMCISPRASVCCVILYQIRVVTKNEKLSLWTPAEAAILSKFLVLCNTFSFYLTKLHSLNEKLQIELQ